MTRDVVMFNGFADDLFRGTVGVGVCGIPLLDLSAVGESLGRGERY